MLGVSSPSSLDGSLGALACSSMRLFPQLPPVVSNSGFRNIHFVLCNGVQVFGGQLVPSVNKATAVTMATARSKFFVTLLVFMQNHQKWHFLRMKFPPRHFWFSKKIGQKFSKNQK
jgi:hypothetical protein